MQILWGGGVPKFTATELTRIAPTQRFRYVAFNIKAVAAEEVKLVLKKKTQAASTATEIINGAGVYRKLTTTDKLVVMAYDISSTIKTVKNDIVTGGTRVVRYHGRDTPVADVNSLMLAQGTTYTLYAVKRDGTGGSKRRR